MKLKTIYVLGFLVVAVAHLFGILFPELAPNLATLTKPLLLWTLLLAVVGLSQGIQSQIILLLSLGLIFSWLGDVALMYPGTLWFMTGLVAFFIAHIFYVILFFKHTLIKKFQWWTLIYLVWWCGLVWILAPHLLNSSSSVLFVPVLGYGLILGLMGVLGAHSNIYLTFGGALFAISDSVLAINRFVPKEVITIPISGFWVMLSYIAAQALIVIGILTISQNKKSNYRADKIAK